MRAVDQPQEGAIGDRAGHVAQLDEAVQHLVGTAAPRAESPTIGVTEILNEAQSIYIVNNRIMELLIVCGVGACESDGITVWHESQTGTEKGRRVKLLCQGRRGAGSDCPAASFGT